MRKVTFYLIKPGSYLVGAIGLDMLTESGKAEVNRSAKENLTGIEFREVYSSDKLRARETAGIVLNTTRNNQLVIKGHRGLNPDDDHLTLGEIKSIASKVARDAALDGKGDCNVLVVTHLKNILACSGACPTLSKVNNADIVKLVIEVTDHLQEIATTQYVPLPCD